MEDFVTLNPVEDVFLELGKGHNNDLIEVKNWDAQEILNKSEVQGGLKVVAQREDTMWVQYIFESDETPVFTAANEPYQYLSTPLILEIEVGNGSWESSLINANTGDEGDTDTVRFPILPVWKS